MPQNINIVALVGNLTKDPELRHTPSGTAVTTLRVAVNDRVKRRTAENCAQYLAKGRPVGVQGKLTWREWDAQDGSKRQSVEIVADNIQFLGSRDGGGGDGGGQQFVPQGAAQSTDDFPAAATADDDIPF